MSDTVVRLLKMRIRGVSLVQAVALFCLMILIVCVYTFKAGAGQEGAQINDLNREIVAEQRDVRRLREELARLQQPARIERLASEYLNMKPVAASHERRPEELPSLAPAHVSPVQSLSQPTAQSGGQP